MGRCYDPPGRGSEVVSLDRSILPQIPHDPRPEARHRPARRAPVPEDRAPGAAHRLLPSLDKHKLLLSEHDAAAAGGPACRAAVQARDEKKKRARANCVFFSSEKEHT